MLIPTPIVAIDDTAEHTDLLAGGLAYGGAGLIPLFWSGRLHFRSGEVDLEFTTKLSGVRIIFCDFHLQKTTSLDNKKAHYNNIATVIDDIIDPGNGPFVLIVWTQHVDDIGELHKYILESTDKHCHPLAVLPLSKQKYLLSRPPEESAAELATDISRLLKENSGAVGLWFWERLALKAAAETMISISAMADGRVVGDEENPLGALLWRLAVAAVGEAHVSDRPAYALNESLAPILYDRLASLSSQNDQEEVDFWRKALGLPRDGNKSVTLDLSAVANINTALHFARDGEAGKASDRGAVVNLTTPEKVKDWTGIDCGSVASFISTNMKICIPEGSDSKFRLVAVQIQAACDFAQSNEGLVPYVLGVEAPAGVKFIYSDGKTGRKAPGNYFRSPEFSIDGEEKVLCVHSRFVMGRTRDSVVSEDCRYRLREALINQVSSAVYGYGARPGMVSLQEKV